MGNVEVVVVTPSWGSHMYYLAWGCKVLVGHFLKGQLQEFLLKGQLQEFLLKGQLQGFLHLQLD